MMHTRFICFLFLLIFSSARMQAQKAAAPQPEEKTPVNQFDLKGKKHGMWWTAVPPRKGEPGITEFGSYDHGVKIGVWYKMDEEGDLVAIENFRNDVLDGEVKYYERGLLYCVGHYRGLNPMQAMDTIVVLDPVTHIESYRAVSTDQGSLRHGNWRYFNPETGSLVREEEYQVDELIVKRDFVDKKDSIYRRLHQDRLPHKKGANYAPPAGKKTSYTY